MVLLCERQWKQFSSEFVGLICSSENSFIERVIPKGLKDVFLHIEVIQIHPQRQGPIAWKLMVMKIVSPDLELSGPISASDGYLTIEVGPPR